MYRLAPSHSNVPSDVIVSMMKEAGSVMTVVRRAKVKRSRACYEVMRPGVSAETVLNKMRSK